MVNGIEQQGGRASQNLIDQIRDLTLEMLEAIAMLKKV
jgi:hypothetical protein